MDQDFVFEQHMSLLPGVWEHEVTSEEEGFWLQETDFCAHICLESIVAPQQGFAASRKDTCVCVMSSASQQMVPKHPCLCRGPLLGMGRQFQGMPIIFSEDGGVFWRGRGNPALDPIER